MRHLIYSVRHSVIPNVIILLAINDTSLQRHSICNNIHGVITEIDFFLKFRTHIKTNTCWRWQRNWMCLVAKNNRLVLAAILKAYHPRLIESLGRKFFRNFDAFAK